MGKITNGWFALGCATGLLACAPATEAAQAKIADWNGTPAIIVDGKPVPPMLMTMTEWDIGDYERPYFKRLGEAGLRVFFVTVRSDWQLPPDAAKGEIGGTERARRAVKLVLEEVPDAYIVLRYQANPPAKWVEEHPEELVIFSDGKPRPTRCPPTVNFGTIPGMWSLYSEKWRERTCGELRIFLEEMRKMPEYKRIISVFLGAGSTSEWGHAQVMHTPEGAYGDFSEPCRAEYERFLRAKYGTVENLRKSWRRPDATFEKPIVPNLEEREYELGPDERIALALTFREGSVAKTLPKFDRDSRGPHNVGTFLNMDRDRHVHDWFTSWHEGIANSVLRLAKTVKDFDPNLLTGAFYGGLGCCNYHDGGTQTGTRKLITSDLIDFLANPGTYNNRELGGAQAMRTLYDSYKLHNKLFINEDDTFSHRTGHYSGWRSIGLFDSADSCEVMKRGFGCYLATDTYAWWFDMGGRSPYAMRNGGRPDLHWYDDPEMLKVFARQQEVAKMAYARDRRKGNEIAILCDMESIHVASRFQDRLPLDFWRVTDVPRIGAGVDFYFRDDVTNPKMPDYKLYIALNDYMLTDAAREAIWAKAKRNNAAILWMYAPGFINPDAEKRMDAAHISKTVGMEVKMLDKTCIPYFRVDPKSSKYLAHAQSGHRYGTLDRDIHKCMPIQEFPVPKYVNPGFYVDDPKATVLGRFCETGKPALAMVEKDGVKSFYCATWTVRSDLVASIAAAVGCHIYSWDDDILYANANFVTLHATGNGKRTVRFRRPCSPYEVYEKRYFGKNVTELELDMRNGKTYTWFVGE